MKKAASKQEKPIPFWKLHGAGNDMVVVRRQDLPRDPASLFRQMAHRRTGLGCDQILELLSLDPLSVQIWNGDGTKAEMCANGLRVLLSLAFQRGWLGKATKIPLVVSGKAYWAKRLKDSFQVSLGHPQFMGQESLMLGKEKIPFYRVSVGNPHAVVFFDEWNPRSYLLQNHGPSIENHRLFPKKTNVEFVRSWKKRGQILEATVDIWERGAGATLSCGSGAVAVAAALRNLCKGTVPDKVYIRMTDYLLRIDFEEGEAFLSGPSALVAEGVYFRSPPSLP